MTEQGDFKGKKQNISDLNQPRGKNSDYIIIPRGHLGSLLTFFYLSGFYSVGASIIQKPSSVVVEEGHKVSLVCQATGQPTPTVTWRKAVGHISNERSRVLNGRLEIANVTKTDGGDYICSAKNIINEDSSLHYSLPTNVQPYLSKMCYSLAERKEQEKSCGSGQAKVCPQVISFITFLFKWLSTFKKCCSPRCWILHLHRKKLSSLCYCNYCS